MAVRLGIVGTGRVAHEHARAIGSCAAAELAAVCDRDAKTARTFAEQHGCERIAGSLDDLLADERLDAVVVAVPNALHRDFAIRCLRAGKDVLLEKPMAMNVAQCDEIIRCRNETGRTVQIGFVCRAAPKVEAVKAMIEAGDLGRIYHVKASMYRRRGIPGLGRWFTTKALSGGGVLIDIGVHLVDLAMHLAGAARALTVSGACESRFGHPISEYVYDEMWAGPPDLEGVFDVEDSACGMIRLDNGIVLELNVAWASNVPEKLLPDGVLLLGDRGGCSFDLWGDRFLLTSQRHGAVVDRTIEFDNADAWNRAWARQHERFAATVARTGEPMADVEVGRAVQAIVEAMYESSRQGVEVAIGPAR